MFGYKLSHISSGFIAILIGYTSSVAIIFQAAEVAGANQAQLNSWMLVLGLGMGLSSLILSIYYKTPILTAWSTPGAALLVTSLVGIPMEQAFGAFVFCGALLTLTGISGLFEKICNLVPLPIASAMLAGVLFQFGHAAFGVIEEEFLLVVSMIFTYLFGRVFLGRYTIPSVLLVGIIITISTELYTLAPISFELAKPVFVMPEFKLSVLLSVGLPLYIVTMTSQNMPGVATISTAGYTVPVSSTVTVTGLFSFLLAPFGGYAFNLAAITAAICLNDDADEDKDTRYKSAIVAGVFYCILGLMGSAVVSLFLIAPNALVVAIAGIALINTIGNSLIGALKDEKHRESALITFLVTVSGLTLMGIGAAFWGLVLGIIADKVLNFNNKPQKN